MSDTILSILVLTNLPRCFHQSKTKKDAFGLLIFKSDSMLLVFVHTNLTLCFPPFFLTSVFIYLLLIFAEGSQSDTPNSLSHINMELDQKSLPVKLLLLFLVTGCIFKETCHLKLFSELSIKITWNGQWHFLRISTVCQIKNKIYSCFVYIFLHKLYLGTETDFCLHFLRLYKATQNRKSFKLDQKMSIYCDLHIHENERNLLICCWHW